MSYSARQSAFKAAYEIAPIVLSGGIASGIIGGMLPVLSVIQSLALDNAGGFALDEAFAQFRPLPGSSLIENQSGKYPFANLAIAANCIVKKETSVSMLMTAPARGSGGMWSKQGLFQSLQNTLANHIASGGTFGVATPAFYWTDLLLLRLADVSGGETNQPQVQWRWDFEKPLISLADAGAVQSQMMSQVSQGLPTDGALSGPNAVGPASAAAPNAYAGTISSPMAGLPSFAAQSSINAFAPSSSSWTGTL